MKSLKPLIKENGGNPVALCNRCFCMMCYVSCPNNDFDNPEGCVVIERRNHGDGDFIKTEVGKTPPVYCDKCHELLYKMSLN